MTELVSLVQPYERPIYDRIGQTCQTDGRFCDRLVADSGGPCDMSVWVREHGDGWPQVREPEPLQRVAESGAALRENVR
jgi:hypothetical protein